MFKVGLCSLLLTGGLALYDLISNKKQIEVRSNE